MYPEIHSLHQLLPALWGIPEGHKRLLKNGPTGGILNNALDIQVKSPGRRTDPRPRASKAGGALRVPLGEFAPPRDAVLEHDCFLCPDVSGLVDLRAGMAVRQGDDRTVEFGPSRYP